MTVPKTIAHWNDCQIHVHGAPKHILPRMTIQHTHKDLRSSKIAAPASEPTFTLGQCSNILMLTPFWHLLFMCTHPTFKMMSKGHFINRKLDITKTKSKRNNLFHFCAWKRLPFQVTQLITYRLIPFPCHQHFRFLSSIIHIAIHFIATSSATRQQVEFKNT